MKRQSPAWVAVPTALMTQVQSNAVIVWMFLKSRCNPKRDKGHYVTWVSLETITSGTMLSKPTVMRAIGQLEETLWLYRFQRLTNAQQDDIAHSMTSEAFRDTPELRGRSNFYIICPMMRADFFDFQKAEK